MDGAEASLRARCRDPILHSAAKVQLATPKSYADDITIKQAIIISLPPTASASALTMVNFTAASCSFSRRCCCCRVLRSSLFGEEADR